MKNDPIPLILGRIFNVPLMIHEPKLDVIFWALRDRLNIIMQSPTEAPEGYALSAAEKNATRGGYASVKNLAIIPVYDTLVHRHTSMQAESGMTSYKYIRDAFRVAEADSDISSILMIYDTPGGEANGNFDLVDEIYNARGIKPIVAFVNEIAFSGGYSLASAADTIIMPRTGGVGSIGVIMRHANLQKFNEAKGIEYTTLYAGSHKNDFSPDAPLTAEARAVAMEMINTDYKLFASTVARNRKLSVEHVRGTEAALYWGENAIKAGLADQIGTLDDAINYALKAASIRTRSVKNKTKGMQPGKEGKMKEFESLGELAAAYPDYADQLREEGKKSVNLKEAADTAVSAESQRILGLAGIHFGAEAAEKFKAIVSSGITVEQYRAVIPEGSEPAKAEAEKAETEMMNKLLEAITTQTGQQMPGMGGDSTGPQDFMAIVEEYRAKHNCSKTEAMLKTAAAHPEVHEQYLNSLTPKGNA